MIFIQGNKFAQVGYTMAAYRGFNMLILHLLSYSPGQQYENASVYETCIIFST